MEDQRMAKQIRDCWLLFVSTLRVTLRNPAWVFIGLFQPVCYMLLFAPLLKNLAGVPGFPRGGAYNVFTPGLMMMMAIFGTGFAGFGVIARLREGVIERLRVTPVSRLAMMIGGLTMASCSYAVALVLKNESALAAAVNLFSLPLFLLSGIMLPLSLAPDILRTIATANPFAYAVDAARALIAGHLQDVAVLQAFSIFAVLGALALFWATRSIRKAAM
jgi:ABC-2 type transport system permease protein